MIRNFEEIIRRGGCWIADYHYDEGIRIREDFICPTLPASFNFSSLSTSIYLIEVINNEGEECDKTGLYRSQSGGG